MQCTAFCQLSNFMILINAKQKVEKQKNAEKCL